VGAEPLAVAFVCRFDFLFYRGFLPLLVEQDVGLPVQPERSRQAGWTACFVHRRSLALDSCNRATLSFNDHLKRSSRVAYRSAPCDSRRLCAVALLRFYRNEEVPSLVQLFVNTMTYFKGRIGDII
jgi:hypothetical protein